MTGSSSPSSNPPTPMERKLDTKTVEVLTLAVFRTLFKNGIHLPLKMDGMMDMDLMVRDNNVLLNLNQVQMQVPELSIWRIIFSYRGKPVVEYGRGVKSGMKIHFGELFFLFLTFWREKSKSNRARVRSEATRDREMVALAGADPTAAAAEEAPG